MGTWPKSNNFKYQRGNVRYITIKWPFFSNDLQFKQFFMLTKISTNKLGSSQTFVMVMFRLKAVNYFCKTAPLWMLSRLLIILSKHVP